MTPDQTAVSLVGLWAVYDAVKIKDVVLHPTESGFVQQYVLTATHRTTGEALAIPACIVVKLEGDRIAHVEEYVDPSPLIAAAL